jgi:putative iron-regulated protein
MQTTTKVWLGVGAFLLAGTGHLPVEPGKAIDGFPLGAPAAHAQEGGEGGEGGEGAQGGEGGGGTPSSYALGSTDPNAFAYDAKPQVEGYARLVHATYDAAHAAAQRMQTAIAAFLAEPTDETLARARFAWVDARVPYLQSEAFRFYDGPIDAPETGPEGSINAWPLNEAVIDYVADDPQAGLVSATEIAITADTIRERDQVADEADVTTGWHAIEFLLWGQDGSAMGAGARPASDYAPGIGTNDRRRLYLETVTAMLVDELAGLVKAWAPGDPQSYAAAFTALPQREALGRMLNGMAVLAGFELMSERLAVALDSGDQEDEHSCFSDTTWQDFVFDIRGIRNTWYGDFGDLNVPGMDELVASQDPELAARIAGLLNRVENAALAIPRPFDQVLASEPGSPSRQSAEQLVTALTDLVTGFQEVGGKLGVLVVLPTN